ncbi:hypothetical protein [Psychrobacter sp. ENNN9_III]|uniref:hypothetical protein n=1 Tax=Psychrobacter sp. ENNN9_III TaxID=1254334 RepID=UPI000ACC1AA9|nr:hypothetical protein [Psychrobacter sp. ENNN9_III]
MSHKTILDNHIIPIKSDIGLIDIKGQFIDLAALIRLHGQLKLTDDLCQMIVNRGHETEITSLQIGIDEAGRGPLLGSVNVAGAILPRIWSDLIENQPLLNTPLSILTDSKKLSEKKAR